MANRKADHGCRTAAERLSRRLDQALPWSERAALRLHLMICPGCTNYGRQLDLLRRATRQWRSGGGDDVDAAPPS